MNAPLRHQPAPLVRSFITFPTVRRTGLPDELQRLAFECALELFGDDYEGPVHVTRAWIEETSPHNPCVCVITAEIEALREIEIEGDIQ